MSNRFLLLLCVSALALLVDVASVVSASHLELKRLQGNTLHKYSRPRPERLDPRYSIEEYSIAVGPAKPRFIGHRERNAECDVTISKVGSYGVFGSEVTLSTGEHCHCNWLVLQVLEERGIPCPSLRGRECVWSTAHQKRFVNEATFLVSVSGIYKPMANCPHYSTSAPLRLAGVDLLNWQVDLEVQRLESANVHVAVRKQLDIRNDFRRYNEINTSIKGRSIQKNGRYPAAYFPRLAVTVVERDTMKWVARNEMQTKVEDGSAHVNLTDVRLSSGAVYDVEISPARSWVCQGANVGCQRRYRRVPDFSEVVTLDERIEGERTGKRLLFDDD